MTDEDLRTRIAAVLRTYMFENSTAEELADAVNAELGMTREENNMPTTDEWYRYRYVTEWTTD